MADKQFKVNFAQHRGATPSTTRTARRNEDGTKEFAFVTDREHANIFADTANRVAMLEKALKEVQAHLPNPRQRVIAEPATNNAAIYQPQRESAGPDKVCETCCLGKESNCSGTLC